MYQVKSILKCSSEKSWNHICLYPPFERSTKGRDASYCDRPVEVHAITSAPGCLDELVSCLSGLHATLLHGFSMQCNVISSSQNQSFFLRCALIVRSMPPIMLSSRSAPVEEDPTFNRLVGGAFA